MQQSAGFLKDYPNKKRFGWNKLNQKQIDHIRDIYKQCGSIKKTVALSGHCEVTVQKYCYILSSTDKHSRYAEGREVLKVNPKTGFRVCYRNANVASKVSGVNVQCINKCLRGKIKTAGGYIWTYKNSNPNCH